MGVHSAIVQTTNQSFDFNGESDLDLEYAMGLTNPQPITLLQTGDIVEGLSVLSRFETTPTETLHH
jgi:tripeptidyl-peptidase-1